MKSLLERLKAGEILVADGAMGTLLFQKGLKPGDCPESVNLEHPEVLEEIAGLYLNAGADIIQTNTFGASPLKLAMYNLDDEAATINRNAVLAVRKVVGDRAYVSGSCGPSGRILKPYGDADSEDLYRSFRAQMECLIAAGVDVICVETIVDLAEAALAIKAAKEVAPEIPVMATMTFDATPKGFFTIMGVSIEQAASGLQEAGADVVGSNCGNGIEKMIDIASEFRRCSDLPLIIQSNAGLPKTEGGMPVYDETPAFMADKTKELVVGGVSIIGGCCGTTPEHTRAIRDMVDSLANH
ncbi:MAG: homocysteine S-methyltransferase family protein [Phycisphaerae bacterium]